MIGTPFLDTARVQKDSSSTALNEPEHAGDARRYRILFLSERYRAYIQILRNTVLHDTLLAARQ